MKPVRIFRHLACEGPAYLATLLAARGIPCELVAIDADQPVPTGLDDVSGLVFLGGSMSVNDDLPWIAAELDLIRRGRERDLPMLGICLGSQLISKALGATVARGDNGLEIGWHTVKAVSPVTASPWLDGLPQSFTLFHWHGETFDLPGGAVRLLQSDAYPNQAYAIGRTLALQCHPEMNADTVRDWVGIYAADLARGGHYCQSAEAILDRLEQRIADLHHVADRLLGRWIATLDRED